MNKNLCPNCSKGLIYNEKTGILKYRNDQCRHIYTPAAFRRRNVNKSRLVTREGITSNYGNVRNNESSV
jgi:hypothetical protein